MPYLEDFSITISLTGTYFVRNFVEGLHYINTSVASTQFILINESIVKILLNSYKMSQYDWFQAVLTLFQPQVHFYMLQKLTLLFIQISAYHISLIISYHLLCSLFPLLC